MPTALMPDRSLLKLFRKADSDALLPPPMELTRFWKLRCSEATAVVPAVVPVAALVVVPVAVAVVVPVAGFALSTESMRSCSAAAMCPPWPWWPPCRCATPEALLLDAAAVLETALLSAVAPVPAVVAVAAPLPVPWDCSAATRFWMKVCIACCGLCVFEDTEVPDVPVVPAAAVVVVSVVDVAVPAAVVAVVELSAPD